MTSNIVEIDNLSFGYKGRLLHKNINMVFPRGKVVAIMGGSGSGKTTLLRLPLPLPPIIATTLQLWVVVVVARRHCCD